MNDERRESYPDTGLFAETRRHWPMMTFYEKFEQVVAIILSFAIAVVIVIALFELLVKITELLFTKGLDPLDHAVFQTIFGMIMTLLIAMEFKHSIIRVVERKESIIQVKTVILIAILALARKFIIIDTSAVPASKLGALAAIVLALGVVYWLVRESDNRKLLAEAQVEEINDRLHNERQH